jgi:hypothetical protein
LPQPALRAPRTSVAPQSPPCTRSDHAGCGSSTCTLRAAVPSVRPAVDDSRFRGGAPLSMPIRTPCLSSMIFADYQVRDACLSRQGGIRN